LRTDLSVTIQLDSRSESALLSTQARSARCPLRPSSPTRRFQRATLAGQLSLFDLRDTANRIDTNQAPPNPTPSCNPSAPMSAMPSPSLIPKRRTRKPQSCKSKPPATATVPLDAKLLVSREEAAGIVSLSIRSIDYLLASKELPFRKIGTRTMIPLSALQAFARMHHPERIAS
jgi:hypothetical protein